MTPHLPCWRHSGWETGWLVHMELSKCRHWGKARAQLSSSNTEFYNLAKQTSFPQFSFEDAFVTFAQSLSHVQLFVIPWTAAHQAPLSLTVSQSLLKFVPIESVVLSNNLILCCPLPLLPSVFPSIRVFSNESALCIRWPQYRSFSFSIRRCFYSTSFFIILSFLLNIIFHHFLLVFLQLT